MLLVSIVYYSVETFEHLKLDHIIIEIKYKKATIVKNKRMEGTESMEVAYDEPTSNIEETLEKVKKKKEGYLSF